VQINLVVVVVVVVVKKETFEYLSKLTTM